jgi:hypothetical protein
MLWMARKSKSRTIRRWLALRSRDMACVDEGEHVSQQLIGDSVGFRSASPELVRRPWQLLDQGQLRRWAVLGTRWLTEDLCEGTLIHVVTDRVAVTNFVNHRHLTVTAGHSYLAKAP